MFAVAALELGTAAERFGRLTLRQFGALRRHQVERDRNRQKVGDYRAGVLASLLFNLNTDPEKVERKGPEKFFPILEDKVPQTRRKSQRQLFEAMESIERRQARRGSNNSKNG